MRANESLYPQPYIPAHSNERGRGITIKEDLVKTAVHALLTGREARSISYGEMDSITKKAVEIAEKTIKQMGDSNNG